MHENELDVDADLVRRLVAQSFPDLAGSPIQAVGDSGSTNALYRLGDDLAVRLPRQSGGGESITKEAQWLPYVGSRLSVRTPEPVGIGQPAMGYSETWAITTWIDGVVPRTQTLGERSTILAADLARFITELRAMPVPGNAINDPTLASYRGDPLPSLDDDFRETVEECRNLGLDLDLDEAQRVWDLASAAAASIEESVHWYHGDLVAENVLLDDQGRLAAVLDFGGLGLGNPAVDLVIAWELLDPRGREVFRQHLGVGDAQWAASRGWALFLSMITFPYYGASMPDRCAARLTMAKAALADA
ncbi:aminoglycoside phosphotransferase family protein [Nocardioides rubriscoriae]|uniref:aminoglycoside phosphotransferase family protein n=1 Tax=Nocardioides rubriscoriae TaxID=642762 RepID=UPI001FED0195|nr:aminoglycoside phosphotransferase family protein [Nocardioides rubriscoriae]